jgi:serine/threonine-protein kinase
MAKFIPDWWQAVSPHLDEVLAISEEKRDAWLADLRTKSPEIADRLEELLDQHADLAREGFLEHDLMGPGKREGTPGQAFGAYVLVSPAGAGGMGAVWRAKRNDGRFDREVAIKLLHVSVAGTGEEERFKREGAILGRLQHPHIAELIDAGVSSSGQPYLVLEYVDGEHIDKHCNEQNLDVEARIRLFLDVLDAVSHAHANLIVHRDIKPSNVMISREGKVKLLDFGIARLLEDETQTTQAGKTAGAMTLLFASPEQVKGEPVTTRTDVYALGVLLYLLLAGRHPAGHGPYSTASLVRAILDTEPPRPSQAVFLETQKSPQQDNTPTSPIGNPRRLSQILRGDLDRILGKAVRKQPTERYPSAAAFADDLRRYLEHKPISARSDSLQYRAMKFMRRNRVAVAVAAIAFLAIAAGLGGIILQGRRARADRDFAFRQLVRLQRHDEFLDFLLANAAPSGKPFTVNDLLDRADHIVEKQKPSPDQIELLDWIGVDYSSQDQHGRARPVLERAYQLAQKSADPAVRARSACSLGYALSRDEDLTRADVLIQQGLREMPADPKYAIDRIACLREGSELSRQKGETTEAVRRMEMARQALRQSRFDSDEYEMGTSLDLAAAYSEAGRDQDALREFQRAGSLMSALGRDETQTAVVLYNDWALELEQVGRPLDAEKLYRRVIDISRDNATEDAVSPMVLNNYARVQRQINHLSEAADYAERAYAKAQKTEDALVINQSLLERSRIYLAEHDWHRAEAMLVQVEPRLRKALPPGHYAFAAISGQRGMIAMEKHDLPAAQQLTDEAIAIVEAAVKKGGEGAFYLPTLYSQRSAIDLVLGRADQAETDADKALTALNADNGAGVVSSKLGLVYLARARARSAEGKSQQARTDATLAFEQLQKSIGSECPDTVSAQRLAE